MDIREKIKLDKKGLEENGPITIVALGDSVTHGALDGFIDYEMVYWNVLRKKINAIRDYVPVNVINAAIGGTTSKHALDRFERDVVNHNPDLVIVCFGLNEVNFPLEDFLSSLKIIFSRLKDICEVIYLTPNMLNSYVARDTPPRHLEYAKVTAKYQSEGKMDYYIEEAKKVAFEMGVGVCDCYAKWKQMEKDGIDTTKLLINRVNHPDREMHKLFADSLFDMIFGEDFDAGTSSSTMIKNN